MVRKLWEEVRERLVELGVVLVTGCRTVIVGGIGRGL